MPHPYCHTCSIPIELQRVLFLGHESKFSHLIQYHNICLPFGVLFQKCHFNVIHFQCPSPFCRNVQYDVFIDKYQSHTALQFLSSLVRLIPLCTWNNYKKVFSHNACLVPLGTILIVLDLEYWLSRTCHTFYLAPDISTSFHLFLYRKFIISLAIASLHFFLSFPANASFNILSIVPWLHEQKLSTEFLGLLSATVISSAKTEGFEFAC